MTDEARYVRDLAAPLADARHVDLVDVQVKGSGSARLVRVVVDRKGGVDLDTCRQLSGDLSALLDADRDPIAGRYQLEVTSPGVDHPLRDRPAFDRVEGRAVLVHRRGAQGAAPQQVRGTVRRADEDAVVLDADGGELRIPYGDIVKAKQTLPW